MLLMCFVWWLLSLSAMHHLANPCRLNPRLIRVESGHHRPLSPSPTFEPHPHTCGEDDHHIAGDGNHGDAGGGDTKGGAGGRRVFNAERPRASPNRVRALAQAATGGAVRRRTPNRRRSKPTKTRTQSWPQTKSSRRPKAAAGIRRTASRERAPTKWP